MKSIEEIIQGIKENLTQTTDSSQTLLTSMPVFKCEKCHDTGWVFLDEDENGYHSVRECECVKVKAAENRIKASGLADEIKEKTFKRFQVNYPWQKEMYDKAVAYGKAYFKAKESGKKLPWFFIAGNPGCGKTHICTAICGVMLKRGVPVSYMQWVTDSRKLRAVVNEPDFDIMLEPYLEVEILYIDDLFKQPGNRTPNITDAEGKVLFEIVNGRYVRNKATIISTEWYLDSELMQLDDGTFSRVYERAKDFRFAVPRDKSVNQRMILETGGDGNGG